MAFKYRAIIQYDGTNYHGWQYQHEAATIQGTIEAAMARILQRNIRLLGAGRTDAGVHADYQVAHFIVPERIPVHRVRRALNAVLPWDIRIRALERVPHAFHARFSAAWKEYVYQLYCDDIVPPHLYRYSWHLLRPVSFPLLMAAAKDLVGTYNYAPFGKGIKPGEVTLRTILWASWENQHPLYIFHIASRGFLRGMVRYIVGVLVEIGLGRRPVTEIQRILTEQDHDGIQAKAPARGLCLKYISYPKETLYSDQRTTNS